MEIYPGFERDFHDALRYMNSHSPHLPLNSGAQVRSTSLTSAMTLNM